MTPFPITLNHVNLPVTDVAVEKDFFVANFDFTCTEIKGDNMLAVLKGSNDFTLVLMSEKFNRSGNTAYPDAHHIGFLLRDKEEVYALHSKLQANGIAIEHAPQSMRGVYGFYFTSPGGVLIEVSSTV